MPSPYSFVRLDSFANTSARVTGINNSGQIVGSYTDAQNAIHGFVWQNAQYATVDAVNSEFYNNILTGINDSGVVVGYDYVNAFSGAINFGFAISGGTVTAAQPAAYSNPTGIDDSGQIVGNGNDLVHPAINEAYLANPPYTVPSQQFADPNQVRAGATFVNGINAAGTEIVGYYLTATGTQAFLYNGTYKDIPAPAGDNSIAYGVNDVGQVVGSYTGSDGLSHGFVYDGTNFTTLDDPYGTEGTTLTGINDLGQIVGNYLDGTGSPYSFLITPDQLTQAQLTALLTPITGAATGGIIDYLHAKGLLLNGATINIETANFFPQGTPDLSILSDPYQTINAGGLLKFAVVAAVGAHVYVQGTADIGVSAAVGNDDFVLQDSGNDTVFLGGGNNTVQAGAGVDTIFGGNGNDLMIADTGAGSQFLMGDGKDVFVGGAANSYVDGGNGDDTIYGGTGNDTLHGGSGNDVIYAGSGSSYLYADTGDSTLYGGSGSDTMFAGSGNARLVALGSGYNELHGGSGNDVLVAAGTGSTLMVAGSGNTYMQGSTVGNNSIGGAASETMYGGSGLDTLQAGSGNDRLISGSVAGPAGQGNLLLGSSGNVTMWAGAGNDTLTAGSGNALLISGAGSSQMNGRSGGSTAFEVAYHTGNDSIAGSGSGNAAFIDGRASTDGSIVTSGATTTVTFADTSQVLTFTGVQHLYFSDTVYSPP